MESITRNKGGKVLLFAAGVLVCMVAFAITTLALSPVQDIGYSADGLTVRSVAINGDECILDLATPEGPLEIPGLLAEVCDGVEVGDDVTETFLGEESI